MIVVNQNITFQCRINGGYFTSGSTVTVVSQSSGQVITVDSIDAIDDDFLEVTMSSPAEDGMHNIIVTNETGGVTFVDAIEVRLSTWFDLRSGGDNFTTGSTTGVDMRHRNNMTPNRDAQGLYFTGNVFPWQTWVKFENFEFNRSDNKILQWIFTPAVDGAMMIGIHSSNSSDTSTSQFFQGETLGYFNSGSNFWGLFGNNGNIGSSGQQANGTFIPNQTLPLKLKLTNSGSQGGECELFQLPSADPSDWDDESVQLASFTIGGTINPDEQTLYPSILPRAGFNPETQRFIAFKLTDV